MVPVLVGGCGRLVVYGSLLLLNILPATTGLSDAPSHPYEVPQPPPPCPTGDTNCRTSGEGRSEDEHLGEDFYKDIVDRESLHMQPGEDSFNLLAEEDEGWDKDTYEEGFSGGDDSPKEEAEVILDCVFSNIPIIGGKWLTRIFRERVSDATLIEATNSFIDGGELLINLVNLKPRSAPVTFFKSLSACFDFEDYDLYTREEVGKYTQEKGDSRVNQGPQAKISSSALSHQRKRRSAKGGYGKDTLYGFSLLGLLIVGSLIAYLIYLLTM
ncbi:uncharacterized protein LOC122249234 [Penaeus japonicus]|uniref:uncharacterized protein LOC122249234 n=1 Tax=Penaeus japonicus TaxID=27405 RepID=UPI001C7158E3|nr:uncharacterized protein LOC122249234 [Penaeus japonicus]